MTNPDTLAANSRSNGGAGGKKSNKPKPEKRRAFWSRFAKYSVLLFFVAVLLRITFDSFSFYLARRDLDTELRSRKVPSLEYLNILSQRERALALTSLEGRCLERVQLTMFRIFDAEQEPRITQAYRDLIEKKNAIVEAINKARADLIDVKGAVDFVEKPKFRLSELDRYLEPKDKGDEKNEEYKNFRAEVADKVKVYASVARDYARLRQTTEEVIDAAAPDDLKYWDMTKITELAANYRDLLEKKDAIYKAVRDVRPGLIERDKAVKFVKSNQFQLAEFAQYLDPLNASDKEGEEYREFRKSVDDLGATYVPVAQKNVQLRREVEKMIAEVEGRSKYWDMKKITELVDRIDQVRKERAENKAKMGDVDDLIARHNIWAAALTGGLGGAAILDDVAYQIGKEDKGLLKSIDCQRFKEYYEAVSGRVLKTDSTLGKSFHELTWSETITFPVRFYSTFLLQYFQQAPQAQTLFVTLFLGALGALTLNILRLSRVGWWADPEDPLWGEIMVGPFLGALAAFGIFLIGSAGLLLAAEGTSSQPPSAYFIGLLGFISGLMYDQAFGRVRRVGEQMFGGGDGDAAAHARPEDRSVAELLKANSASRAAELILKHGTQLSSESEFTLLIPSDEAMGRLPLTFWTKMETDGKEFSKWYIRHIGDKRVRKQDVPTGGTKLHTEDGDRNMKVDQDKLMVDGIAILIADVIWNKGVIHILSCELPDAPPTDANQQ